MKTDKKYKPLVYICNPFSGDVKGNTKRTRQYSYFTMEQEQVTLTPHLMFPRFTNDAAPDERELAIFADVTLLGKCDEIWVFGDNISADMSIEIKVAKKRKQAIRYFNNKCEEVEQV